jgi:hypothetical protein
VGTKPSGIIESYLKKTFGKHKLKFLQAKYPRTTKTLDVTSGKYKLTLDDKGEEGTVEITLSVKKADSKTAGDYNRRVTAAVDPKRLWKELEAFLYPSWYPGSGYRGDLKPGPDLFLIEDFYQKYDPREPIPDEIDPEFVAKSFARVKEETEQAWERKRRDVISGIQEAFGSKAFEAKAYNTLGFGLASSDLPRLAEEDVLEEAGYRSYRLSPRYRPKVATKALKASLGLAS